MLPNGMAIIFVEDNFTFYLSTKIRDKRLFL